VVHPVLRSVLGKWKPFDVIFVYLAGKMEEDTEGSLRKETVCGIGKDMIARKVLCRVG
jgi:hypothetical protein